MSPSQGSRAGPAAATAAVALMLLLAAPLSLATAEPGPDGARVGDVRREALTLRFAEGTNLSGPVVTEVAAEVAVPGRAGTAFRLEAISNLTGESSSLGPITIDTRSTVWMDASAPLVLLSESETRIRIPSVGDDRTVFLRHAFSPGKPDRPSNLTVGSAENHTYRVVRDRDGVSDGAWNETLHFLVQGEAPYTAPWGATVALVVVSDNESADTDGAYNVTFLERGSLRVLERQSTVDNRTQSLRVLQQFTRASSDGGDSGGDAGGDAGGPGNGTGGGGGDPQNPDNGTGGDNNGGMPGNGTGEDGPQVPPPSVQEAARPWWRIPAPGAAMLMLALAGLALVARRRGPRSP